MKVIYSGTFQYKWPPVSPISPKIPAGQCTVDIVKYENGVYCVMMSESKDNRGVSVTGACDRIATQVHAEFLPEVAADTIVWLEHSPAGRTHRAYIDLVQFQCDVRKHAFHHPQWKRFIESPRIVHLEFLENYGYVLKELRSAHLVFETEDRNGYHWRIWANREGFFAVSANPSAGLSRSLLDVEGVNAVLRENRQFFGASVDLEEQFTTALMKSFLNKGL